MKSESREERCGVGSLVEAVKLKEVILRVEMEKMGRWGR